MDAIHMIPCNLPFPTQGSIIGRRAEIDRLSDLLSPRYAAHLISVDGIGGVGKTALVLEVAYRCLRASTGEDPQAQLPTFEAIIFASAKQQYLTSSGIRLRSDAQRTLRHVFRAVAFTLNRVDITESAPEDQYDRVRNALSCQRTLLIVDNLETMEDKQAILSFLYELPPTVKAVVTSRERALFSPIRLEQMSEEEATGLIQQEAWEKGVGAKLCEEQARLLYQRIGGIPAALTYAVGQLASGYSLEAVLGRIPQVGSDVSSFCFDASVKPLRGRQAHHLLMALAMFPRRPLLVAVAYTAGLANNPTAVEDGLAQLEQLSLVNPRGERYRMLPLTREYTLAELAAYPQFEGEARTRWVEWYLDFVKKYGGDDWAEWHIRYDRIEEEWENLLAVFDWCVAHDHYHQLRAFWQAEGLLEFSTIYGHWNDRLTWLDWLIHAAERRGDWPTAVEALEQKGYTLTMTGHLEEADALFQRAWSIHQYADSRVQSEIAQKTALLRVYQGRWAEANSWLECAAQILDSACLDELEYTRHKIITQYYHGLRCYKIHDYDQAEVYFREVIDRAQEIGWPRGPLYAQNWLAGICIAHGKLDEAELLLQTGLILSQGNKDRRRTAHYQATFALLYLKRKNLNEARYWAREALEGFESLGMLPEAGEMQKLLQWPHR